MKTSSSDDHASDSSLIAPTGGAIANQQFAYVVDRADDAEEGDAGQGINIHLVWNALRRWWPICLGLGLLLAACAGTFAWYTFHPIYRATGWLRIESSSPYLVYPSRDAPSSAGDDRFVRTQLALLRSPVVIERALARSEFATLTEIREMVNPVSTLGDLVKATAEDDSDLYRISYSSQTAKNAALIVNTILEEFVRVQQDEAGRRNQEVADLLRTEAKDRELEMAGLRSKVIELGGSLSDSDRIDSGRHATAADEWSRQLAGSEAERTVLESEIKVLEAKMESLEAAVDETELRRIVQNDPQVQEAEALLGQEIQAYKKLYSSLQTGAPRSSENADAGSKSAPSNGDRQQSRPLPRSLVLKLKERRQLIEDERKRIEELKTKAQEHLRHTLVSTQQGELERLLRDMRTKLETQKSLESLFAKKLTDYQRSQDNSDERTVKLEFAMRDLQRGEAVYDGLMERINKLETEASAPARVSVLKIAAVPDAPLESSPMKRVLVASLAAFCVPFMLVLLRESIAQRIGSAEQLPTHQNVPLFAEIPSLPSRSRKAGRHASAVYDRSRAAFENSVHYLCRSLMLGQINADFRVLAVTSSVPSEGKTNLAAAIAASMARCSHEPVLLVDTDLRKPSAHLLFETTSKFGLADVLSGDCSLDEAIVKTTVEDVWLLPAGQVKLHPHAVLHPADFARLLDQIRGRFSLTILDTSPALAVGEALTVCKMADGVLLCAMRDVTRRQQVTRACDRLRLAGIVPMGIVLSGVDAHGYESRNGAYYYKQDSAYADEHASSQAARSSEPAR